MYRLLYAVYSLNVSWECINNNFCSQVNHFTCNFLCIIHM